MLDEIKKSRILNRRAVFIGIIKLFSFIIIILRYYYLQITESSKYRTLSDKNRIKFTFIPPIRGVIKDRKNQPMAQNVVKYRLNVDSRDPKEIAQYISEVSTLLSIKLSSHEATIKKRLYKHSFNSFFPICENVSWDDIVKIEVNGYKFPKLVIDKAQKRYYIQEACHILGYTATPNKEELTRLNLTPYNDLKIGKNGVEKIFDLELRGKPGARRSEVNAHGEIIRDLAQIDPKDGQDLVLSINFELQRYASKLLHNKSGSIVVIDVRTGELLVIYSSPGYDPNLFEDGISRVSWDKLSKDPTTPLINKAITSAYPPGSTFKVVTALAGLQNSWDPRKKIFCSGVHQVGNRKVHCWKKDGHGAVDLELAVAQSCNIYFYEIAEKIGMSKIAKVAHELSLGSKTGIELPFEVKGNIPENKWKFLRFGQSWNLGDTINASIGQGFILTTPIQLALMAARIASGKKVYPTILKSNGSVFQDLKLKNMEIVRKGMNMVFNDYRGNGFNKRLVYEDFEISGKTGTAQVISKREVKNGKFQDHGLFIGFASYDNPRYALSVIIENGSWGAISALPIGIKMFEKLYKNENKKTI